MNNVFENVKKNLGFGCMRLPMIDKEVDYDTFSKMIDTFLENGFNYFDTAHMYVDQKSEIALRECLVKRHPRESFVLANKLSNPYFKSQEEIIPFFENQLKWCAVTYFDFYLMHAQDNESYEKYKKCKAYETCLKLKDEGKIKHFGISFHDKASVLEKILTEYPQIEFVQIQFNYADYESESVEGRKCYEVCQKFNKPIIVMEPVKGGKLVNLNDDAKKVFDSLDGGSYASYAIRFAASFDGVFMVLSGMGNMDMINDNISFMKNFKKLDEEEFNAVKKVCDILKNQNLIDCTSCRYCIEGCPKNIPIPDIFSCINEKNTFQNWNSKYYYDIVTYEKGKAKDCIECGKCEKICPQHLPIKKLLKDASKEFDK